MNIIKRYLTEVVKEDLKEKMVFIGGPRQVGKTTLACNCIGNNIKYVYFNYDKLEHRKKAIKGLWHADANLIILDEFHKYPRWKTWLKGEWDTNKNYFKFLITGSARLNIYRRGGDSLQGRYHYFTLHPFSISELGKIKFKNYNPFDELNFSRKKLSDEYDALFQYGGFPEPLLKENNRFHRRWSKERFERFIKEDIRDLTNILDMVNIMLLADLLKERSSNILSINSLAEDIGVNFRTVANWLNTFELFYYCFRINPYKKRLVSSVKKEKKLYLWDWSIVQEEGRRFENIIASHLLKFCDYLKEYEGYNIELNYIRDINGREVDFVVTVDDKPWFAVETKLNDIQPGANIYYFKKNIKIPYWYQVVSRKNIDIIKNGIRIISADKFLTGLI